MQDRLKARQSMMSSYADVRLVAFILLWGAMMQEDTLVNATEFLIHTVCQDIFLRHLQAVVVLAIGIR